MSRSLRRAAFHPVIARTTRAAAVMLVAAGTAYADDGGRWVGAAEMGYDSYEERYSISEDDTLSRVQEARARLRVGYAWGLIGRNHATVEARQMVGSESWESSARAALARRFGTGARHTFQVEAEAARRGYRDATTYEFPNDYTRGVARAGLRARVHPALTVRVDNRTELIDYEARTEFDYDYVRNATTVGFDAARDPLRGVTLGARVVTMSIPDSSEIEYDAITPLLEARFYGDAHRRLQVSGAWEHRRYPEGATRSSFRALLLSAFFEWPLFETVSVELADQMEHYDYLEDSSAYTDYVENSATALVNWYRGTVRLGVGPAWGWVASDGVPDEEYREVGLRVAMDIIGHPGVWVSATYEPGSRDYTAYDASEPGLANADVVFSDYDYHRVSVFAAAHVYGPLWLNAFLDYQPEDHEREGDDATATIVSLTLSCTF